MARVLIRKLTLRDERRFLAAARRSRELHGHYADPPLTPAGFRSQIDREQRPNRACHAIVDRATRELVGVINLNEIVRGHFQSAYVGYYAFEPLAGRGLMSEGLGLVLRRAFGPLELHRVEANIQPENARSIALVKRHGFRCEGYSPKYLKICGRWRDHERWALVRESWRPGRRASRKR